jgi:hypothetical protein
VDLDELARRDVPAERAAAHDQRTDLDVRAHVGALPDHQHAVAEDLADELAVDPDAPLERQLPLEARTAPEQRMDLSDPRQITRLHQPSSMRIARAG